MDNKSILFLEISESYFGEMFTDLCAKEFFCKFVTDFVVEEISLEVKNNSATRKCLETFQMFFVRGNKEVFVYEGNRPDPIISLNFRIPLGSPDYCEYYQGSYDQESYDKITGKLQFGSGLCWFFTRCKYETYLLTDGDQAHLKNLLNEWVVADNLTPAEAYKRYKPIRSIFL